MKHLNTKMALMGIIFATSAVAQPSDGSIKAKIKSSYSDPSKVISIKLSDQGRTDLEEDGYNYYRSYEAVSQTEYSGVKYNYFGMVKYKVSGGTYTFSKTLIGEGYYTGIPNPSDEDIKKVINASLKEYLQPHYHEIIGDLSEVRVADDPKWKWEDLNRVSVNTVVSYTRKVSYRDVENQTVTKRITMFRSNDGINYDDDAKLLYDGKWIKLNGALISRKNVERGERRTLSEEELANTRTLMEMDMERQAKNKAASLPKIDIPDFHSANHVIQFTHELMIEGDKAKIEAFLYKMLPDHFFEDWSDVVLNGNGEDAVERALRDADKYKVAFCKHPKIKHQQENMIQFYDRSRYRFNRIAVTQEGGEWKVKTIEYTIPLTTSSEYADLQSAGESNCGDPLDTSAPIELAKYDVGDKCQVKIGGEWHNGEVSKVDNMMDDRYFVKPEGQYGKWVTADVMRPWDGIADASASTETSAEDAASTAVEEDSGELKVGDRVEGNWKGKGRWYKGTIKAKVGKRYLIHYDDGDKETTTADMIKKI